MKTAGRGLIAGLAATLLLSALARILPGMGGDEDDKKNRNPTLPHDPFNPDQVRRWQSLSQSPVAHMPPPPAPQIAHTASPAGALQQPQSPGPEGLAEQFAFKIASGIFDRDISPTIRPAGMAVHLMYGSSWGLLYGILQSTVRQPPRVLGALYGLGVWLVGPGLLVPAMKLMRKPSEEPPVRTAMLIAGHVAYGVALAEVYGHLRAGDEP